MADVKQENELKKLDPAKVEALRKQLRSALALGESKVLAAAAEEVIGDTPHTSHADNDGWA
jgi:hypothetical protein